MLEEAGGSLEALDLNEGHYIGAFSHQGEVITMSPGGLWITFHPSGTFDRTPPCRLSSGAAERLASLPTIPTASHVQSGSPTEQSALPGR